MSSKNVRAQERAAKAAAAFAEAKRKQRRRNILSAVAVAVAVLVIIGAGVGINTFRQNKSNEKLESNVAATTDDYSLVVGDDSAPHKIVVYEDFICPICGVLEATAGERLNALIADGKVQVDYRPIAFLGTYSDEALNALFVVRDQAGVDVAKKFHDILFANQPDEQASSFPGSEWFIAKAVEAGATEDQVKDGIENGTEAGTATAATEESNKDGVTGTPTILLDGKIFKDGANWEEIGNNLVKAVE